MHQYLLELGTEEIPARFMSDFINFLKTETESSLKKARLSAKSVKTMGSYRRLTIIIDGLAKTQSDIEASIKGPPAKIAFDANKKPLPAAIGFAKKNGVPVDKLQIKTEKGQDYVYANIFEKGQKTKTVLPEVIESILKNIPLPIAMTWGEGEHTFFRPVRWITSLLDSNVLPITFLDQKASRYSHGHRFLSQNKSTAEMASGERVSIASVKDYETTLKKGSVTVDQNKRKKQIKTQLLKHLSEAEIDADLLEEVTHLVECPKAIVGSFDKSYLNVPDIVLIQCMKKHQKYFPIKEKGKLTNQFIFIADNVTAKNKLTIQKGNENVLKARLEDAKFFWEEDKKEPLDHLLPKLDSVVFQAGLGSLSDKINRMKKTGSYLAKTLGFQKEAKDIDRSITLSKADLVSLMVFELPDLQGKMGALYAKAHGENKAVVQGVEEQYLPKFSGDTIPKSKTGLVLALADKVDTIVACFVNDLIPTGSQDPWGVRRAVYGIANIVCDAKLNCNITDLIDAAYKGFKSQKNKDALLVFIAQRFQSFITEKGLSYDSAEAAMATYSGDLLATLNAAKEIDAYRKKQASAFKGIVDTAVRVARLAKKAPKTGSVSKAKLKETIEKTALNAVEALIKKEIITLKDLAKLTPILSQYFDDILIMDKNKATQNNRLLFLKATASLYHRIADFEKIAL